MELIGSTHITNLIVLYKVERWIVRYSKFRYVRNILLLHRFEAIPSVKIVSLSAVEIKRVAYKVARCEEEKRRGG